MITSISLWERKFCVRNSNIGFIIFFLRKHTYYNNHYVSIQLHFMSYIYENMKKWGNEYNYIMKSLNIKSL